MTQSAQSRIASGLLAAWTQRGLIAWALWPISLLYGLLVLLRRQLYRLGLQPSQALPVPVVVVGNVVTGGVGKTPVVIALVQQLQAMGWVVGVVSKGHGRRTDPGQPDCREVHTDSLAHAVGDEPLLIRQRTGAPLFIARHRVEAAQALLKMHPSVTLIVTDDGLQHLALRRDMEICVFDDRGAGNGFLLPAGPLREPWPRLPVTPPHSTTPVQWVLHTGTQPCFEGWRAARRLADAAVRADGTQQALTTLAAAQTPLLALAGIAQPTLFFAQLKALGLNVVQTQALPDHYDFNSWRSPSDHQLQVICTEKDAVKLWRIAPEALAVPLVVELPPLLIAAVSRTAQAKLSSPP
jgi:tetraacyldisaccharide 4'-kinase